MDEGPVWGAYAQGCGAVPLLLIFMVLVALITIVCMASGANTGLDPSTCVVPGPFCTP